MLLKIFWWSINITELCYLTDRHTIGNKEQPRYANISQGSQPSFDMVHGINKVLIALGIFYPNNQNQDLPLKTYFSKGI